MVDTATSLQERGCRGYCRGNKLHPPDEGDEFGSDEYVEAYSNHLFSRQQLIFCVSRENLLQLRSPLLPVSRAGEREERERERERER